MSTSSIEIEQAVDRVAKLVSDIRTDVSAKHADMGAKIEAAQSALLGMQQAQAAAARAQVEAAAGTDRDLAAAYVVREAPTGPDTVGAYVRAPGGGNAVQIGGRYEKHVVGRSGDVVREWRWGLLDDPEPRSMAQLELQRAVTDRSLARKILAQSKGADRVATPSLDRRVMDAARACGGEISKIFADSAGIGAEWVPDTFLPELERDVLVPTNVTSLFRQRNLPPGGVKIPSRSGRMRVLRHAVPTIDYPAVPTLSTLTTANGQIDPIAAYVGVQIDRDFEEDSIIQILPEIRSEMARAIQFAEDDCVVNGDSTASHQDAIASWDPRGELGGTTGLGTTADHRRRWLGLRARAYDLTSMTTDQSAAKTFAGMRTAIGKLGARNQMGGYASKSDVVILTSWDYFFSTMLDATAFSEFITFEKVGALASVLSGQLGNVGAIPGSIPAGCVGFLQGFIPVCIAWPITADLAASGLFVQASDTKTGFLAVDRSRHEYCVRKGAMLESETSILQNTNTLMMRYRTVFRSLDAVSSSIKDVHWSYNL